MKEEKCAQNVLFIIYSILESLLKSDLPLVINPYSINKSTRSVLMQNKISLKEKMTSKKEKEGVNEINIQV